MQVKNTHAGGRDLRVEADRTDKEGTDRRNGTDVAGGIAECGRTTEEKHRRADETCALQTPEPACTQCDSSSSSHHTQLSRSLIPSISSSSERRNVMDGDRAVASPETENAARQRKSVFIGVLNNSKLIRTLPNVAFMLLYRLYSRPTGIHIFCN